MEKEDYMRLLDSHDWFYEMSDDIGRYDAGKASKDNLIRLKRNNPDLEDMYQEVYNSKMKLLDV